jgi:hypothetical protein
MNSRSCDEDKSGSTDQRGARKVSEELPQQVGAASNADQQIGNSECELAACQSRRVPRLTKWRKPEVILALATVALAAFTYFLYRATDHLYEATRDLVNGADQASAKQLRAYVYFEAPICEIDKCLVHLKLINGGKTWARKVTVWEKVIPSTSDGQPSASKDLFPEPRSEPHSWGPGLLGPGQVIDLRFGVVEFKTFVNGKAGGDFFALVQYEDTVGIPPAPRQTQLSLRLTGDEKNGVNFTYNSNHNCADDDCQK